MRSFEGLDNVDLESVRDRARERFVANTSQDAAVQFASEADRLIAGAHATAAREADQSRDDRDRFAQAEKAEQTRIAALTSERDKAADEHSAALAVITSTIGERSASHARIETAKRDAELLVTKIKASVGGRGLRVRVPLGIYIGAMALYGVGEAPLTEAAFRLAFEQDAAIAWVFAFLTGGLLVGFAHFSGGALRQITAKPVIDHHDRPHKTSSYLGRGLGVVGITAVAMVLMYVVAVLRQEYFTEIEAGDGSNVADAILGGAGALETIAETVRGVALKGQGLDFFLINGSIYTFGCLLSFWQHDPHPEYAQAVAALKRASDEYAQRQDLVDRKKAEAREDYRSALRRIDPVLDEHRREVAELQKKSTALPDTLEGHIQSIAAETHQVLLEYRSVFFQEMSRRGIGLLELRVPAPADIAQTLRTALDRNVTNRTSTREADGDAETQASPSPSKARSREGFAS